MFLITFIAFTLSVKASHQCTINFGAMRENEPLFLHPDFSFMLPNDNKLTLQSGNSFLIDCGEGRNFAGSNIQQVAVTCQNGQFFSGNNQINVDNLQCNEKSPSTLIKISTTTQICGNDGRLYQVGFNVLNGNSKRFVSLFEACFNEQLKSVFYVKSEIYGSVNRGGTVSNKIYLRHWSDGRKIQSNFFALSNIARAYKFFDRGHLSPNADYQFAPMRKATHTYFNMVPMDGNLNQNIWSALETHVRNAVKGQKVTATVYTGGFSVNNRALSYENRDINLLNQNEEGDVYPMPGSNVATIIVPDLLWKIVKVGNAGLALFMFEDGVKIHQNYCQDQCVNRLNFYCCNVNDFIHGTRNIKGQFDWPIDAATANVLNWLK